MLGIKLFQGKECQLKAGCTINLESNTQFQKFNSNASYYLIDGDVSIEYDGESHQVISSPYTSTWTSYIDSWDYSKNVTLRVLPSTLFLKLSLRDSASNTDRAHTSSVLKLTNSSITKSMNSNTSMIVIGSEYSVDGNQYTNQITRVISAKTPRELSISTQNSCSLIYIEPI